MNDKLPGPINFRPNREDRSILDKLLAHLARVTKQPAHDTAAIRYAIRAAVEQLKGETDDRRTESREQDNST